MSEDNETTKAPSKSLAPGPPKQATVVSGESFEVLIETVTGHRTIRRVSADSEEAAVQAVQREIDLSDELGTTVIDSAPSGQGLGSE